MKEKEARRVLGVQGVGEKGWSANNGSFFFFFKCHQPTKRPQKENDGEGFFRFPRPGRLARDLWQRWPKWIEKKVFLGKIERRGCL